MPPAYERQWQVVDQLMCAKMAQEGLLKVAHRPTCDDEGLASVRRTHELLVEPCKQVLQ